MTVRRMWVQLSLAFGLVVVFSSVLLVGIGIIVARLTDQPPPLTFLRRIPNPPSPGEALIFLALLGGAIGLIGGVGISRRLARPLSDLAESARSLGKRDFQRRVTERGTEEIREVSRAFNEMAAALDHSERLRSSLLTDVAHELRTPLSVMEGSLRAILDDVYPLSKTEILHLYDQTLHLSRLVDDLHELTLAESNALRLNFRLTDIGQVLSEAAAIFAPVAESEGIRVNLEISPPLPLIPTDERRLKQMIQNLLVNAFRHTPEGGSIHIQVGASISGVWLEIKDTGVGIPESHLPFIFERFYRADPARSREQGGAGLGLAISKAIITAHGGTITVQNRVQPPTGTCFRVELPLK